MKENKRNKRKKRKAKQKQTCSPAAGRVRKGTRLLFAGTISPVICPVDGPTEGRHDKTRRKTKQEEGRDTELKNKTSSPMSIWWAQGRHMRPKKEAETND